MEKYILPSVTKRILEIYSGGKFVFIGGWQPFTFFAKANFESAQARHGFKGVLNLRRKS